MRRYRASSEVMLENDSRARYKFIKGFNYIKYSIVLNIATVKSILYLFFLLNTKNVFYYENKSACTSIDFLIFNYLLINIDNVLLLFKN